jgi:hypothetical protein
VVGAAVVGEAVRSCDALGDAVHTSSSTVSQQRTLEACVKDGVSRHTALGRAV